MNTLPEYIMPHVDVLGDRLRIEEDTLEPINLDSAAVKFLKLTEVSSNYVFADIRILGDYSSLRE